MSIRYLEDYEEQCKRCKGECGVEGMSGCIVCHGFVPKTNADRIRAMGDDKLAKYLSGNCPSIFGGYRMHSDECSDFNSCQDCWLDWLKQECDENGT